MRFNLAEFIEIFCNSVKDFREKAFDSTGIELLVSDSSVDKIIKNERKSSLILDAVKTYKDQINNDFSGIDTDRWARNDLERAYRMVFEKEVGNKSKGEILINLLLEASSSKEQGEVADGIKKLLVKEQFQSDENLRKYLENKMITEDDVNYFRNEAEKWFDLKKNDGRYRGYYYSKDDKEITRITNKFIDSNNEERDLIDIIFESENENTYSVNLFGIGGSGKTFQIFRCIDYILKNKKDVIPFYIPINRLKEYKNANCIIKFLQDEIRLKNVENYLKQFGSKILIFADGLNEISQSNFRRTIAIDICKIREEFKTRFLVSSRLDHTHDIYSSLGDSGVFRKANVSPLTQFQVEEYFNKINCNVKYSDVSSAIKRLISTPQGCVMYSELVGSKLEGIEKIDSLGKLIEEYYNRIIKSHSNSINNEIIEEYYKKIAFHMVSKGTFNVSRTDIRLLIGNEGLNTLTDDLANISSVFSKNTERNEDRYEFSHQNYRDYFCAKLFAEKISEITAENINDMYEKIFVANNITNNNEILELASAFIDSVQTQIDILRRNNNRLTGKYKDNYDFPLSIFIRLYAYSHRNCIASLNLSNLNLKEICLSGYELYDRVNGNDCINLNDSEISLNTFLKPGLQTASSTVCKYTHNGKLYVAAFSATNIMIIDVAENQIELIRDLTDYGWVNCAVVKENFNGKLCIFLGCRNGSVALFYPENTDSPSKQLFISTKDIHTFIKGHGEIESIEFVTWNNCEYIVFCNSEGDVYYRELYPVSSLEPYKIPVMDESDLKDIKEKFEKNKWVLTCHLCHKKDDNTILIGFGNNIFCLGLVDGKITMSLYNVNYKHMKPELILDIKITEKYIFLNEGKLISVIDYTENTPCKKSAFVINLEEYIGNIIENMKADGEAFDEKKAREWFKKRLCGYNGDVKDFFFKYFSAIPSDYYPGSEGVLVGIEAIDGNFYEQIAEFFEVKMDNTSKVYFNEVRSEQILATHTGVYYKISDDDSTVYIATTSDDRSVDIITPDNEEMVPIHYTGAYNGVHDISIIDSSNILCAMYDGSVIHLNNNVTDSDDFFEGTINNQDKWHIENVFKSHNNWVWKVLKYNKRNNYLTDNDEFKTISCSYDGTVRITDFGLSEQELPLIKSPEEIIDFDYSNNTVWAISPRYIFTVSKKDNGWTTPIKITPKNKINHRALAWNKSDNIPWIFYNSGNGTPGKIGYYSNNEMNTVVECNNGVFLRCMKCIEDYCFTILICAGVKEKKTYICIYKLNKKYSSNNKPELELVSELTLKDSGGGANSFTYFNTYGKNYLLVASKNNRITFFTIDNNYNICQDENKYIDTSSQPMCIENKDNMILAGLLNGKIIKIELNEKDAKAYDFVTTNADLYANPKISLKNCKYPNTEVENSVKKQLSNYFSI